MTITQSDLDAYLDEALAADEMAAIEKALREDGALTRRLAEIISRRNAGVHSVGEIWRTHRLSCPTREQLGSYLLGALGDDILSYIEFHLKTVGCRYCLANLEDLQSKSAAKTEEVAVRRRRYFESSVGLLRKK